MALPIAEGLEKLGFSELEAKIYVVLLQGGSMSAYQIAKKIEISRPSIYNALEHMLSKGFVELIPNETALYIAKNPKLLLERLRDDFAKNADSAERLLASCNVPAYDEQFINIVGFEPIIYKAREIMRNTCSEIYINTDMNLDCFSEELALLNEKGIRVVIYSFYDVTGRQSADIFTHGRRLLPEHNPTRLMVVADNALAITAGPDITGAWKAIFTGNQLFVKIISEHIHNDIYLLKLRDTYGREIYDKLHIFTDYENRNRQ